MIDSQEGGLELARSKLAGKRMVLVLAWSVLGGAERSALATALYLRDEVGADVHVVALTSEDGRARELFSEMALPWHAYSTDWYGGRRAKVRQLASLALRLRGLRPGVLLPYTSRPNILCGLVWRSTGASLCVWNQQDVGSITKFGPRLRRRAIRQTPLFVANSSVARAFLVSEFGAREDRVHVVLESPPPPKIEGLRDTWRDRLGISDGVVAVSMLAHLHAVKDHATLLRAWRLVLDELPGDGQLLLLAGRPSGTEHSAKAVAFDLELGRTVRFLGDVQDVDGLLAASDIGVLTSRSESRPHAILESAAAGLPVVATDIPGIREALGAHQTSYLAPAGDAEQLGKVLVRLISDPALRAELGQENRRLASEAVADPGPQTAVLIARALTESRVRSAR